MPGVPEKKTATAAVASSMTVELTSKVSEVYECCEKSAKINRQELPKRKFRLVELATSPGQEQVALDGAHGKGLLIDEKLNTARHNPDNAA